MSGYGRDRTMNGYCYGCGALKCFCAERAEKDRRIREERECGGWGPRCGDQSSDGYACWRDRDHGGDYHEWGEFAIGDVRVRRWPRGQREVGDG